MKYAVGVACLLVSTLGAVWAFCTVLYTYEVIRAGALPSTLHYPYLHISFSGRQFMVVLWVGTGVLCGAAVLLLLARLGMIGEEDVQPGGWIGRGR